mgnify:CR=1 FL=1
MHCPRFNFTRIFTSIAIVSIAILIFPQIFTPVQAATGINRQINFQGKLVNNPAATNVTDTGYTVVFTLYDNASGANTALWTETQTVTTVDGIFRVALGSVTAFPANFNFNWDGLYLGIKVNADSEMTPRIRMAAVPFAFNAEKVSGLTVQDTSGNASTSGTLQIANAKTVSFADAFTTSGAFPLTLTSTGTTNATIPSGTVTLVDLAASQTLTNKIIGTGGLTFTGATTDITTGTNEDLVLTPNGSGKIGFNITAPLATFDIRANAVNGGTLSVASISGTTSFAALVANNDGVGDLFTASSSGTNKFTVQRNGLLLAPTYNAAGCTLKADTNGLITCGVDNNSGGSGSSGPFAEVTGGIIVPNNSTVDFLVGGQSTSAAKFAFINMAGARGLQTASVSGSLVLDSSTASIQSTNNQALTIGGNTTGNVLIDEIVDLGSLTTGIRIDTAGVISDIDGSIVDVNDTLNANALTSDAGVSIAAANSYTGAGAVTLSSAATTGLTVDSGTTGTLNIGTGANAKTITLGNATTTTTVNVNSGTGGINLQAAGTGTIDVIQIGAGGAGSTTPDFFALDVKSDTGDPAGGAEGYMYYNTLDNKFRCYQGAAWTDCITAGGGLSTRSFIDTTSDAVVDNLTTSYWDLAAENNNSYPNITPSTTSKSIWGVVTLETQSTGTGDVEVTARVEVSATSGTACNSGTAVGGQPGTFASNTNARKTSTTNFIYSPASTAARYFNICADTDSVGTTANVTRLRVTLFEVDNSNADLAELYSTADSTLEPGELVSLDPNVINGVKRTVRPYDSQLIGVISTEPALLIGGQDDGVTAVPVALAGRVPVKVSTENGPVKPGDMLTSSSFPGVAMKATKAGTIVGQAMTGFDGEGIGSVMVFIKNGQGNGAKLADILPGLNQDGTQFSVNDTGKLALTQFISQKQLTTSVDLSEIVTDRVAAGLEVITPKVTTKELSVDTISASTGKDIALNLTTDGKFIVKNASGSSVITFDANGNAYFSGLVFADRIKANQIEGLEIFTNRLSSLDKSIASVSGSLNAAVLGSSTQSTELQSELTLSSLNVDGLATVSADLTVKGSGLFQGALNVLESITTQNLLVSQFAYFINDVVFKGNVRFNQVPTFSKDTAGFAVIKKDDDTVAVTFDQEYNSTPVITASIVLDKVEDDALQKQLEDGVLNGNIGYVITQRTTKGFVVRLNKPASQDINFSWVALSVKDARTSGSQNYQPPTAIPSIEPTASATPSAAVQSILNQLNNSSN